MTPIQRVTLDMPVDLNDAVNAAVKRTRLSKAQYMRMALEVLGLLAGLQGDIYIVRSDGTRRQILIPGVVS